MATQPAPIVTAFDWVPDFAKGLVRDLRVRWALEELGEPYAVQKFGAANPRPDGAFGSADLLRIHVGRYRVMYGINDTPVRVSVIHLGRLR